jgi:hypothetical protein
MYLVKSLYSIKNDVGCVVLPAIELALRGAHHTLHHRVPVAAHLAHPGTAQLQAVLVKLIAVAAAAVGLFRHEVVVAAKHHVLKVAQAAAQAGVEGFPQTRVVLQTVVWRRWLRISQRLLLVMVVPVKRISFLRLF